MVIIPSNEATGTEGNAISVDLDRPLFPPIFFYSFLQWTSRRKAGAIKRQHLLTFWGWKRRRAVEKSDRCCLVWLWPHKVSVGSGGRHSAKKRAQDASERDKKKPESLMAVLDFGTLLSLSAFLLAPLSLRLSCGLSCSHCPFPFSQPTWCCFQDRWVNQDIFWMGHKSATGIGDRVKVVGDERDKAR